MTTTLHLNAAGRTHIGLIKRRNEDAMHLGRSLFAVADGLGGHVAGDIASTAAIATLQAYDRPIAQDDLADALGRAVSDVNAQLRRRVAADPALVGMATTLVAMLTAGDAAVLANVGDSRAYRLRRRETTQLTEDHTYQHLVADADAVPHLPERLARFLDGRTDGRSPDLTPLQLQSGDRYLLCSDGLSSYVAHHLIHTALAADAAPDTVADNLITLAIEHGAPDNVTAVIVDIRAG